ncbi:hypothetical protein BDW59DRAFT_167888 [Aspergillus cavernicola]|uniref:Uncharacterized protein n=1 Tax=Aspergillus cavernicola TaxID=176166 RepID=A0ABR4HBG9_9EURO
MSWHCFPGQMAPSNRNPNPNPRSHTQSDRDRTDAEPPKTGLLSPPWNPVQEAAAAKISSPHGDPASCPAPIEEIVHIAGARPPYDGQRSQLEEAELTALVVSQGGTTSKNYTYKQVQSTRGGPEALTRFQTPPLSFNSTPPVPKDLPKAKQGDSMIEIINSEFKIPADLPATYIPRMLMESYITKAICQSPLIGNIWVDYGNETHIAFAIKIAFKKNSDYMKSYSPRWNDLVAVIRQQLNDLNETHVLDAY